MTHRSSSQSHAGLHDGGSAIESLPGFSRVVDGLTRTMSKRSGRCGARAQGALPAAARGGGAAGGTGERLLRWASSTISLRAVRPRTKQPAIGVEGVVGTWTAARTVGGLSA